MAEPEGALVPPPSNPGPSPAHLPSESPFDKLTTEMFRRIFTFTFSPEDFRLPPWPIQLQPFASNHWPPQSQSQSQTDEVSISLHIMLSLVCKNWLAIISAHHSLWATFQIDPIAHLHPRFTAQVRLHLQRSGAHALKIQVQEGSSDEAISDVLDALMGHSERWESIELHFPMKYAFLRQLDEVRERLPLLKRLHLRGPREAYTYPGATGTAQCATFQRAPALNEISLEVMDADTIRVLDLPWPRISHARLDFHTATGAFLSSSSLQTLTTLTLYRGGTSSAAPANNLNVPVTLQNLHALHVLSHTSGMPRLTCPALQDLRVSNEDGASILAFLDNSTPSSPLTRLQLQYVVPGYPRGEGVPQILRHSSLAGVTFLELARCGPVDGVLDALVRDSGPGRRLPVLETLVLGLEFNAFQLDRDFEARVEGLRKIIESRTYPTRVSALSLDSPEPCPALDDIARPGHSLKDLFLNLTVDAQGWKTSHEEEIERLRKFCMEMEVLVLVDITYAVENPNVDQFEQGFRNDGSYDVFDADYTDDIDDPL